MPSQDSPNVALRICPSDGLVLSKCEVSANQGVESHATLGQAPMVVCDGDQVPCLSE